MVYGGVAGAVYAGHVDLLVHAVVDIRHAVPAMGIERRAHDQLVIRNAKRVILLHAALQAVGVEAVLGRIYVAMMAGVVFCPRRVAYIICHYVYKVQHLGHGHHVRIAQVLVPCGGGYGQPALPAAFLLVYVQFAAIRLHQRHVLRLFLHMAGVAGELPVAVYAVQAKFAHRIHGGLNEALQIFGASSFAVAARAAAAGGKRYHQIGVPAAYLVQIEAILAYGVNVYLIFFDHAKGQVQVGQLASLLRRNVGK